MKYKIICIGMLLLLLSACGDKSYEPVAINLETDTCATCSMGIEDEQASAQIIQTDGTPQKFDDIGCFITYMQDNKETIEKAFVHDHNSKEWIDMDTSFFIHSTDIKSPMSYGIIAFSTEKDAKSFQEEHGGDIYSKDELLAANMKDFKKDHHETESH